MFNYKEANKASNMSRLLCATLLIAASQLIVRTNCQVSDLGDEQFEFQHQDIGRISGLSSGSPQVAAQTTIVSRHQQHQLAAPTGPPHVGHEAGGQSRTSLPGSHPAASRQAIRQKPNRITLVPKRDPSPSAGQVQPSALIAAQLPAPSQPTASLTTTTLLDDPVVQPTFAPLDPQTSHQHQHQQHHHHHDENQHEPLHHQQVAAAARPALSSFRATGGSVSARHAALVAQVAAERAAAAAAAANGVSHTATGSSLSSPIAHSFGSPAEALSSPQPVAVAVAGQQQQHHHHHQQQPAFASFTNQQYQQSQLLAQPIQAKPSGLLVGAPSQPAGFVNQPEEPLVAPSFEQVLGQGCPHKGVFSWENRDHCDRYYMCTNGTFTEETCPNGLAYSQQGAIYQHCAYNWNVNCGAKKAAQPIGSPGCPWQFGIFPIVQAGRCSLDYFVCEWGVPDTKRCTPEGLFYDDRIKGCQWADQLGCKSESLLNFKCPPEDEDNQFWPFPRYYHTTKDVIVCVNEQPRLVHCTESQIVDPGSLACMEINKKKQKF